MDNLSCPQEADGVRHIGIPDCSEDVIVGRPGLLFCSHVFRQIGNDISLGLELAGIKRNAPGSLRPERRGMVDIIGTEAGVFDFFHGQVFGELIDDGADHFEMSEFVGTLRLSVIFIQVISDFFNRFENNINLQSLPLSSAIAHIADNNLSEFKGSFDVVVAAYDGWYRVEGYRDFDGSAFGFANMLGGANIPYCYDRKAGADAVLKKLGEPDIKSISGSLAYNLERVPQNAQAGISAPSGYVITKINIVSVTNNTDVSYRFTSNNGVNQGFTGAMSKDLNNASSVTVICEKSQNITVVSGSVSFNVEIKKT